MYFSISILYFETYLIKFFEPSKIVIFNSLFSYLQILSGTEIIFSCKLVIFQIRAVQVSGVTSLEVNY